MNRTEKQQAVTELNELFSQSSTVVVTHYHGLTVAEAQELRNNARKNGVNVKITKNTLARIAANDTAFDGLKDILTGPTALLYSDDAVAPAKVTVDFAKDNEKLIIVGGAFDGKVLDESGVQTLAKTPGLDESRAKIVGLLNAPASRLVSLFQAPGGQVARVIQARSQQSE